MAQTSIAIIGAGISGLCTAVALQKQGFHAEVYEKEEASISPDTGIVLSGNAIRSFYIMGLGRQMSANGIATDHCFLKSDSGEVIAKFDYRSPSHIPNYLIIQRSIIYKILTEALLPGTLHFSKDLIDFSQNTKPITMSFRDGSTAEAEYLIGSDGTHSPIRNKLVPENKLTFSGSACWRGFMDNPTGTRIEFSETWGARGRFGIAPMPGNQLYWYAFKKMEPDKDDLSAWTSIDLLFNFFYYHDPVQQILENTPPENIIYDELYVLDPLDHFCFGNILLMGDSAHASMPNIGHGASQAIEDAVHLSKWLAMEDTIEKAFTGYEYNRQKRMQLINNEMKIYGLAAKVDFPILCSIRNKLLQLAPDNFHNDKLRKVVEMEEELWDSFPDIGSSS
jgi:FAD-dependent urate hydroxylase